MVFSGFFKFPLVNELNIFYCCNFHAILAEIKTNGAIFKKPIRFFFRFQPLIVFQKRIIRFVNNLKINGFAVR